MRNPNGERGMLEISAMMIVLKFIGLWHALPTSALHYSARLATFSQSGVEP